MLNPEYIGQRLIERGFRTFFLYLFKIIEGREFIVEPIHADLFVIFEKLYKQVIIRSNINIPPRSAKTTMAKYFIVYCWTINPKCNFIYTSYSQSLLSSISSEIQQILEHPAYKAMYPNNRVTTAEEIAKPLNDFWEDYLYKETGKNLYTSKRIMTYAGGVCLFSSIGAQITGYGCFSYDTLVLTEKGYIKIGDIVENKLPLKIASYNFENGKKELEEITDYIKNDESEYIKLILDNKEEIECTPDHIFYLSNGQAIRADQLKNGFKIMSDSFYLMYRYIQCFRNMLTRIIFIKNKFDLFVSKIFGIIIKSCSIFISLVSDIFGNFTPNPATLNITNRTVGNVIVFCYFFIWAFIFSNSNGNFFGNLLKFMIGIIFILHILFSRTITKIFKSVVSRIRVKMSNLFCRFSNKCKQYKSMHKNSSIFHILAKINSFITFFSSILFKKLVSFSRIDFAVFRNVIPVKFRYRKVVNIVNCKHISPSYCLTLCSNNNFYITKSQVLVHNCGIRSSKGFSGALIIDDANKPADIRHQVMREKVLTYYSETLLSRLNNSNVAIVNIQQRLHIEDLSGLLQARYQFETLAKPLIDENGICQIPSQYTKQRLEELQIDNYVFSAQYQQQPIILGGAVIRREWFKYYQTGNDYNYKRILITADTAMKVKEHNDFSVFMVGAITPENKLHILDMVRGKWEAPDLKQIALNTFNKYRIIPKTGVTCSGLYVEDKASGIGLVQELQRAGLPISPLKCDTDKLTRTESILTYIESGQVMLPNDENYGFNPELIKECESFTRDDSHLHDDIVDALDYLIIEGLAKQSVSLLDYFM